MVDARSNFPHARGKRGARGPDWWISELAERQHGVVARRQLLTKGVIGSRGLEGRLERHSLHPVHKGVYAVGHRGLSLKGRWMAAVLACGDGAVLSHRSAGQAWQLVRRVGEPIEVTRPSGWRGQVGIRVYRARLPADEVAKVDGISMTGVSRTLLDLAALLDGRQLERAMNEAEVLHLTDRLSIPDLLERYPRRPGTAVLRAVLRDETALRGITRNDFEELFVALLDADDLPRPRFNADLAVGGRFFEADCLWEKERLVIELDGRAVHGTARAFESDRDRDRLLLVDGWRVVRLTWLQLCDEPQKIVADLRRLLVDTAASTL